MVKANIKGIEYTIPTAWNEVPYSVAIAAIKSKEDAECLSLLTGISVDVLNNMKAKDVSKLFNCVKFRENIDLINDETPQEKYASFDYGSCTYSDTEAVKIILANNKDKNFMQLAPDIIKKLTGDDISYEPFSEVIGSVGFFLSQWMAFILNSQNSMIQNEPNNNNSQELTGLNDSEVLQLG